MSEENPTIVYPGKRLYWSTSGGTVTYSCAAHTVATRAMKLPSLKTAAANYKKAKRAAEKARIDLNEKRTAYDNANSVKNNTASAEENARLVLLQVAGK